MFLTRLNNLRGDEKCCLPISETAMGYHLNAQLNARCDFIKAINTYVFLFIFKISTRLMYEL